MDRPGRERILFRRSAARPGRVLAFRGMLVLGLFAVTVLVFYLDRDGLVDAYDGQVSFSDVVYFTMVTVTTVGYGDIVPVGERVRLIDALFVTPVRLFVWLLFLGTAYEFVLQRVIEDWRMSRLQRRLNGHLVVCGFGNTGRTAAAELVQRGHEPDEIVVIDSDPERVRAAAEAGYVGLHGEATQEELLRLAAVDRAAAVIVAVGRDDTTALAVLTIRGIGVSAPVIAAVYEAQNRRLLKNCGADQLVAVWLIGGAMLANAVTDAGSVALVQDLVSKTGRMMLRERAPEPGELGRTAAELTGTLLVGIQRDGTTHMFWQAAGLRIEAGDWLTVIDGPGDEPA